MASYKYKAMTADGKTKRGTIEANSLERASDKLKSEGYNVLELNDAGALDKDINIIIGGKVKS